MNITEPLKFDSYCFRASSIGKIMTDPQGKSPFDEWNDAKNKLDSEKLKNADAIQKVKDEMSAFPVEKQQQKGYLKLKDRLASLEESFDSKIIPLSQEVNRLFKHKDDVVLSKTCIAHLIEIYTEAAYGRKDELVNRYVKKGNQVEEKAIELLSDVENDLFSKNTRRVFDDYFQGECDIDDVQFSETVRDVKASWDLYTFVRKTVGGVDINYWWQGQIYLELFGGTKYLLCYVLINTPEGIIKDEKRKLLWAMGSDKEETIVYQEGCAEIDFNNIYDDIPKNSRLIKRSFDKDEEAIEAARKRVIMCRKWLNDYAQAEFDRITNNYAIPYKSRFVPSVDVKQLPSPDVKLVADGNPLSETAKTITEVIDCMIDLLEGDKTIDKTDDTDLPEEDIQKPIGAPVQVKQIDIEDSIAEIKAESDTGMFWFHHDESDSYVKMTDKERQSIDDDLLFICRVESGEESEAIAAHAKIIPSIAQENMPSLPELINNEETIAETNEETDLLLEIEKLQTSDEVVVFYKRVKDLFDKYPNMKKALEDKRNELKPKLPEPPPQAAAPEKKKPVMPPMPKIVKQESKIETPVSTDPEHIQDLRKKLDACKTGTEVQQLYRDNKEVVSADQKLMIDFIETGKKRTSHPL